MLKERELRKLNCIIQNAAVQLQSPLEKSA